MKSNPVVSLSDLRVRAEQQIKDALPSQTEQAAPVNEIVRELQMHKVEVGMQYEALLELTSDLEISREHYRELFDLAPIGLLTLSAGGQIEEANAAAARLFDMDIDALVGQQFAKFIVPNDAISFERHRRNVEASPEASPEGPGRLTCELKLASSKGNEREVRLQSVRTGVRTGTSWRTAIVDVTEINRLEAHLRQAQRLEAVATLVSGVAHDFNNVLAGIMGCTEIALARLDPKSEARAPIERAKRVTARGASVVRQLLAFARNDGAPTGEHADLNKVLTTIAPLLEMLLGDDVKLHLDITGSNDVSMDATQLEQIILNLATNARHAMPYGGALTIKAEALEGWMPRTPSPSDVPTGPGTLLTITDTGFGMDTETQARAFDPFFTTKPTGVGTGLGLWTVYTIVNRAHGDIELESNVGVGTIFRIFLPRNAVPAPAATAKRSSTAEGRRTKGMTVMLVEDERTVRLGIRYYLEKLGYDVLEAESAEEALATLRCNVGGVHLLVSDVSLPGVSGPELERAALGLQPNLKTLLVSAYPEAQLRAEGKLQPDSTILQKPFTQNDLAEALDQAHAAAEQRAEAFRDDDSN